MDPFTVGGFPRVSPPYGKESYLLCRNRFYLSQEDHLKVKVKVKGEVALKSVSNSLRPTWTVTY